MNAIPIPVRLPEPDALRGTLVLAGLNIAALDDAIARIEEIRFARSTPQAVREALGTPLRAAREALASAAAMVTLAERTR